MPSDIVLLAGPLVRASSWQPTAGELSARGWRVHVPEVLSDDQPPPSWREWSTHVLRQLPPLRAPVVVGHSSAGTLAVELAIRLGASGVIIVDGDVPPRHGPAVPVRPSLRDLVRSLADDDGMLPVWSRWFDADAHRKSLVGVDRLANDLKAFAEFEAGLPRMTISWFDDTIELAPWDHIPAGFIQTSAIYDHAAEEAHRRGWPCIRLDGTHLHPTLKPDETSEAIVAIIKRLAESPSS
ncbi:alpha/beta hydrolase [Tardiphaga sp. 768_D3_N2_1]|uniref:alpha/beta hydrolase n=1 Tax=Tardiphaga sp. 768_D3_N2_1 TaxID=3240783 RepID=UPI003F889295